MIGISTLFISYFILYLMLSPEQWILVALPLLLATFSHRWFWHVLAACSIGRFLIPSPVWDIPIFFKHLPVLSPSAVFLLKLTSLLIAITFAALLLRLKERGTSGRKVFFLALVIFVAAVLSGPFLKGDNWGLLLGAGFSVVFRGLFWPLAAVLLSKPESPHMPRWQIICLLSPAWTYMESMFIPLTPFWLSSRHMTDDESRARTQAAGLRLLLVAVVSMMIMGWFDSWAFGREREWIGPVHEVVKLDFRGLYDNFLALRGWSPESPLAVAGFLALSARLFLIYVVTGGLSVAVARLSGFDLPAAVDRPYLAHSVSNFYFRVMRYYGEVLMRVFYPFVKEFGPKLRNRKHRFALNLGLTIFFGGMIYHTLHYLTLFYGFSSPGRIIGGYLRAVPYFFAVATVVGGSALWSEREVSKNPFRQALKAFSCFAIISAVYSLDFLIVHDRKTWTQFLNLWLTLVNGW